MTNTFKEYLDYNTMDIIYSRPSNIKKEDFVINILSEKTNNLIDKLKLDFKINSINTMGWDIEINNDYTYDLFYNDFDIIIRKLKIDNLLNNEF